jgi:hypothetical protein
LLNIGGLAGGKSEVLEMTAGMRKIVRDAFRFAGSRD